MKLEWAPRVHGGEQQTPKSGRKRLDQSVSTTGNKTPRRPRHAMKLVDIDSTSYVQLTLAKEYKVKEMDKKVNERVPFCTTRLFDPTIHMLLRYERMAQEPQTLEQQDEY